MLTNWKGVVLRVVAMRAQQKADWSLDINYASSKLPPPSVLPPVHAHRKCNHSINLRGSIVSIMSVMQFGCVTVFSIRHSRTETWPVFEKISLRRFCALIRCDRHWYLYGIVGFPDSSAPFPHHRPASLPVSNFVLFWEYCRFQHTTTWSQSTLPSHPLTHISIHAHHAVTKRDIAPLASTPNFASHICSTIVHVYYLGKNNMVKWEK